jgi:hypothetical protein
MNVVSAIATKEGKQGMLGIFACLRYGADLKACSVQGIRMKTNK